MPIDVAYRDNVASLTLTDAESGEAVREALAGIDAADTNVLLLVAEADAEIDEWTGAQVRWLWRDFPIPTVFAFDGSIGGQLAIFALSCDIRLCGEAASIELPAAPIGLTEERLRTLLRLDPDQELPDDTTLSATEALKRGLVSRVTPAGEAPAAAQTLAETIAGRGPIATRLAKEAVWRGLSQPLEQALRFETDLTLLLQATKDRAEGVRAFLEKRPPKFTGE